MYHNSFDPCSDITKAIWALIAIIVIVLIALSCTAAAPFVVPPPGCYTQFTQGFDVPNSATSWGGSHFIKIGREYVPQESCGMRVTVLLTDGTRKTYQWKDLGEKCWRSGVCINNYTVTTEGNVSWWSFASVSPEQDFVKASMFNKN